MLIKKKKHIVISISPMFMLLQCSVEIRSQSIFYTLPK